MLDTNKSNKFLETSDTLIYTTLSNINIDKLFKLLDTKKLFKLLLFTLSDINADKLFSLSNINKPFKLLLFTLSNIDINKSNKLFTLSDTSINTDKLLSSNLDLLLKRYFSKKCEEDTINNKDYLIERAHECRMLLLLLTYINPKVTKEVIIDPTILFLK